MATTPADIAAALGRPTPDEGSPAEAQWSIWIDDALMLIEDRLGDLSELDQKKLDYVVREAVVAQVRRPDDATMLDVSVDDGRVMRRYSSGSGRVRVLDEWWDLLSPDSSGKAFTVDTLPRNELAAHKPWCSLRMGATFCSCGANLTAGAYPLWEGGALS